MNRARRRTDTTAGARGPAPTSAGAESTPTRRAFLARLWLGLGFVALAEAAWVVLSFLRPRSPRNDAASTIMTAGPIDDFIPGTVTAFPGGKFYLVRLTDGGLLALHRQCTHLGCTVPWDEASGRFVCPCHASTFDLRGDVLTPPAPRALDLFPIRIENGIVKVDVSQPTRRAVFDPAQVTWE